MKEKDQRVKMMNEILQGIKVNLNLGVQSNLDVESIKEWQMVRIFNGT